MDHPDPSGHQGQICFLFLQLKQNMEKQCSVFTFSTYLDQNCRSAATTKIKGIAHVILEGESNSSSTPDFSSLSAFQYDELR